MKYGKLNYIRDVEPTRFELAGRKTKYPRLCLWKCDCGKEKRIRFYEVESGNSRSCGCMQRQAWRGYIRSEVSSK